MSAGFPLLRLPFLPLKNALDKMDTSELIRLYLCSEKTRKVLRKAKKNVAIDSINEWDKGRLTFMQIIGLLRLEVEHQQPLTENPPTLKITVSDVVAVDISRGGERHDNCFPFAVSVKFSIKNPQFDDVDAITVLMVIGGKRQTFTPLGSQSAEFNDLVDYSKRFFNPQIAEFHVIGCEDPVFSRNIRMAIKGMDQQIIEKLNVKNGGRIRCDDYKSMLDNIKPTVSFKQMTNSNAWPWFTLNQLFTLNCEDIDLCKTKFSNDDMKEYLRQWMAGRFPKLKHLTIELRENVDLENIISGLSGFSQGTDNEKHGYTIDRRESGIVINLRDDPTARILSIGSYPIIFNFSIL